VERTIVPPWKLTKSQRKRAQEAAARDTRESVAKHKKAYHETDWEKGSDARLNTVMMMHESKD
jgi:hypothetical protein